MCFRVVLSDVDLTLVGVLMRVWLRILMLAGGSRIICIRFRGCKILWVRIIRLGRCCR